MAYVDLYAVSGTGTNNAWTATLANVGLDNAIDTGTGSYTTGANQRLSVPIVLVTDANVRSHAIGWVSTNTKVFCTTELFSSRK